MQILVALSLLPLLLPPGGQRFLERIRVVGVQPASGEATVLDPEGKLLTWSRGTRIEEEGAVVRQVTRSHLVLSRTVTGPQGEKGESLVVVRWDGSGKVKLREYSTVSDAPLPAAPPRDLF
jgi:hypothetical protein